jgi:hypothetical protein
MALDLYDLPLRTLAPQHLRTYAEAALAISQLIPHVVASELRG